MKPGMYMQRRSSNNKHPLIEMESDVIAVLENGAELKVKVNQNGDTISVWHRNPHIGQLAAISSGAMNVIDLTVIDDNREIVKERERLRAEVGRLRTILKALSEYADRLEEAY